MDSVALVVVAACLFGGGVLKGLTGAGAPLFVAPALAILYDVRMAVVILLIPNIATNLSQAFASRSEIRGVPYLGRFLIFAGLAVTAGSLALARVPSDWLAVVLCVTVFAYLIFRLTRPHWVLTAGQVRIVSVPAGLLSGFLHGAAGLSAPASVTYFSALGLQRRSFGGAISCFFLLCGATQVVVLGLTGLLDQELLALSALACFPMLAGMFVGSRVASLVPERWFGPIIQGLLLILALKLLLDVVG